MSFAALEPRADGFRNHYSPRAFMEPEESLVDKAQLPCLTGPEMIVLVGGLRVLKAGAGEHGVSTTRPQTLTDDFFLNLLDMARVWSPKVGEQGVYEGRDRKSANYAGPAPVST